MAVDIRSVLIPITGERVLLPNATVAEVITFSTPDPVEGTPDWVLGRVVWRGWRVPVFSLPMLAGWANRENEAGAKIAVLKALGGNPDMPFMAMVTQGFPRLVTVTADSMQIIEGDAEAPVEAQEEPDAGDDAGLETAVVADDEPELEDFSVVMDYGSLTADPDPDEPAVEEEDAAAAPDAEPEESARAQGATDFEHIAGVVRVAGERAVIPDLVPIERLVAQAIGPEVLKTHRR